MEKEYLDFVKPSTYGNKANPSSCDSLYDDVENPELRAIVEKVAATTPYREETSTNEAQSPPNPLKRISGKQRNGNEVDHIQLSDFLRFLFHFFLRNRPAPDFLQKKTFAAISGQRSISIV